MKNHICPLLATLILLVLTTLQGLAQSTYEPYTFITLAGHAGSSGSADGSGGAARFYQPRGVAVDNAGNVYVADTDNNTIRKVTSTGVVTTLAGLAPQYDQAGNLVSGGPGSADGTGSAARFSNPFGVAVDGAGNVYVADSGNSTIRKVTPTGVVTTVAGTAGNPGSADGTGSAALFAGPGGVAVDSAGNVYVADTGNSTIRKVTPAGVVTTLAGNASSQGSADGTGSAAHFFWPRGLAVDGAGNVYVADTGVVFGGDTGASTIRKVTPVGVVTTLAGLGPQYDQAGNLVSGGPGGADGTGSAARFSNPFGVAVDHAGNVYVADYGNFEVRKVTPAGVVTTLAGADWPGGADGTGNAARFGNISIGFDTPYVVGPAGLAVDSAGNVYVADTGNNTIRKGYPALMILNSGLGFGFNGGQFGFNLTGPTGQSMVVEASTDLVTWLPIWTNTSTLSFSDPQSGASAHRFYRARTP